MLYHLHFTFDYIFTNNKLLNTIHFIFGAIILGLPITKHGICYFQKIKHFLTNKKNKQTLHSEDWIGQTLKELLHEMGTYVNILNFLKKIIQMFGK